MSDALLWGLVGGSSFLIGGALALRGGVRPRILGLVMGFGAGALLSAVSFELVDEAALVAGGNGRIAIGLVIGAAAYLAATVGIRAGVRSDHSAEGETAVLVLDVVPEAIVLVGALLIGHGVNAAVIGGVFLTGLPTALSSSVEMKERGEGSRAVIWRCFGLMLLCGLASWGVYALLDGASGNTVALTLAIAGGAVLTNLTTNILPPAYELAGPRLGLAVVAGFAISFTLLELA